MNWFTRFWERMFAPQPQLNPPQLHSEQAPVVSQDPLPALAPVFEISPVESVSIPPVSPIVTSLALISPPGSIKKSGTALHISQLPTVKMGSRIASLAWTTDRGSQIARIRAQGRRQG